MIYRKAYMAQSKTDNIASWLDTRKDYIEKLKSDNQIMSLSLFMWEKDLFLYYECIDCDINPHEIFKQSNEYLEAWPGENEQRYWSPMYDIFHYNRPISNEHWKRGLNSKNAVGRLARIKPEMLSSYIFLHYQYQEEKPCDGDKYGIISLHENLLFFYMESPEENEICQYEPKLKTTNTPDDWAMAMEPHFIYWDDVSENEKIWRSTEQLI